MRNAAVQRRGTACRAPTVLALIVFLVGCHTEPSSDTARPLRFAIIPKALHIPVFDYARTGAERAASCVPIMLSAPGRLSTVIGTPKLSVSF